jgi:hypothetical protein
MKKIIAAVSAMMALLLFSFSMMAQKDSAANTFPFQFITKHSIKIDNKPISYTATVGTLILKN